MIRSDLEINTMRGIACILLVAFHVVGNTSESGLRITDGGLRYVSDILSYVRMPLFTVLSGFIYSYRPFAGDFQAFIKGKANRLLAPLLIVGTIFAILQYLTYAANYKGTNFFLLHIQPVAHFWYLESLFLIFTTLTLLEKFELLKKPTSCYFVFVTASLVHNFFPNFSFFGIGGAVMLFPYIILGIALQRFHLFDRLYRSNLFYFSIVIILFLVYLNSFGYGNWSRFIDFFISALLIFTIFTLRLKVSLLSWIGFYSYTIFLYHAFFTSFSRIILQHFSVQSLPLLFVVGLTAGLLGSVAIHKLIPNRPYLRRALLGLPVGR